MPEHERISCHWTHQTGPEPLSFTLLAKDMPTHQEEKPTGKPGDAPCFWTRLQTLAKTRMRPGTAQAGVRAFSSRSGSCQRRVRPVEVGAARLGFLEV